MGRREKIQYTKRQNGGDIRDVGAPPNSSTNPECFIDNSVLKDLWSAMQYPHHRNMVGGLYGRCFMIRRADGSMMLKFSIQFGHPRTFDVSVLEDSERYVGRVLASDVREFIKDIGIVVVVPRGGADPESESPKRDNIMLGIMIEELDLRRATTTAKTKRDFEKTWNSINCNHEHVACHVRGDHILLLCTDCATVLTFQHTKHGMFRASVSRNPLELVQYGLHEVDAVIDIIRKYTRTLTIPWPMADKMSDDPDRDARFVLKITSLLEQHGLLKRCSAPESDYSEMIDRVSAASCGRADFERWIEPLSREIRDNKAEFVERGKRISARRTLEALRLKWPYWFEGVGFDVELHDPTGAAEFCVKCDFSTLDDDEVHSDHWRRGCPECGYGGYLLDARGGHA